MRDLRKSLPGLAAGLALIAALWLLPSQAMADERPRPNLAALQSGLEAHGHYTGEVDGKPGRLTRRAIARFQRSNGLSTERVQIREVRQALRWRGRPGLGRRAMRDGHRGWDVAGLQYLLQRAGHGPGRIDAMFGPLTREAVARAQREADGLRESGIAGRGTIGHLVRVDPTEVPRSELVGAPTSGRFLRPVDGPSGNPFGAPRPGGRTHQGLDFPVPMGTPIYASAPGTVIFAGWNSGGYGNLIVIQHIDGYTTWYAHLSRIGVRADQRVAAGRTIGRVGSTGNSTGPHLHFEIRRYDTPLDPMPRIGDGRLYSFAVGSDHRGSDSHSNTGEGDHDHGDSHAHGNDHAHGHECEGDEGHGDDRRPARGEDWIAREQLCH